MTKPDIERLKERFETDIGDIELQAVIDAADAEVMRRYGAHSDAASPVTETLVVESPYHLIQPSRPVSTVSSVTEYTGSIGAETTTVLSANDYRLLHGGRTLQRLTSGDNPRGHWGHRVDLAYVPSDDGLERQEVILKIAILDLQFRGLREERAGDYSASYADYRRERQAVLSSLHLSGAALVS